MTSTLERPVLSGAAGPARQTRNRPDSGRRRMLVLSGLLALTACGSAEPTPNAPPGDNSTPRQTDTPTHPATPPRSR